MLAALILFATNREPLLLPRAQKLMKIVDWREGQLTVGQYEWWSPTQVLAYLNDTDKQLIDVRTKKKSPFPFPALRYIGALSPDKTRMIEHEWTDQQIRWTIYDLAKKTTYGSWAIRSRNPRIPRSTSTGYFDPFSVWAQDGKSVYDVMSWWVGRNMAILITQRPIPNVENANTFHVVVGAYGDCGVQIHDGKALVTEGYRNDPKKYLLREWTLTDPASTMKSWRIHGPAGRAIIDYIPSPDYKRALWMMGVPGKQILSKNTGYPYRSVSMRVSDLHGQNMREIGAIPFHTEDAEEQMDRYQHLGGILWNPDSKHVSFVYDRVLYWIAV